MKWSSAEKLEEKLAEIADALLHGAPGAHARVQGRDGATPSRRSVISDPARRAVHARRDRRKRKKASRASRKNANRAGIRNDETSRHCSYLLIAHCCSLAPRAQAADDALYEAAKKEGQVVWYTSLIVNQAVRPLVEAFNKKYPGVEVKYARGDSGPNAIKVINEARAGKVEGDVFDGIATTPPLLKAGLVEPFTPSDADKYPPALRDPEGRWNALVVYFLTPGVNTQLVGKDEIKTAQDLLNPKWKGKIAWSTEPSSGAPVYVGSVLQTMGEDKGMAFLRALAKQDIVNVDATNRAILDQVILGQYAIALSIFNHHAVISAQEGRAGGLAQGRADPGAVSFHRPGQERAASERRQALDRFPAVGGGPDALSPTSTICRRCRRCRRRRPRLKPEAGGFKANFISPATMTRQHRPLGEDQEGAVSTRCGYCARSVIARRRRRSHLVRQSSSANAGCHARSGMTRLAP